MLRTKIIRAPGAKTLKIISDRIKNFDSKSSPGAVGLVHGMVHEIIYAADIAEKAANVDIYDVRGNCPQTMTTIAIVGSVVDVETSLRQIKIKAFQGDIL